VVAIITIIALGEYYSGCFAKGFRPPAMLCYGWALVIIAVAKQPASTAWPLLGPVLVGAAVVIAIRCLAPPRHEYIGTVASSVFGLVYFAVGLSFLYFLRNVDIPATLGQHMSSFSHRMGAVILVLLPVWASDTGAFVAGRAWGRHKLSPVLSPAKTVEGAIGGLLATVAFAIPLGHFWLDMPWFDSIALGLLIGVFCQVGDAIESAIKRDLGLKDFGTILGPHGGALDRFDGVILAMPAAYLYLVVVLPTHALAPGL
jgi:phosphatidate cytidylyltransferase